MLTAKLRPLLLYDPYRVILIELRTFPRLADAIERRQPSRLHNSKDG